MVFVFKECGKEPTTGNDLAFFSAWKRGYGVYVTFDWMWYLGQALMMREELTGNFLHARGKHKGNCNGEEGASGHQDEHPRFGLPPC